MGGVTREEELYLKYQDELVSGRDVTGKKEECLDVQELCDVVKDVFPEAYRTLYCLYPLKPFQCQGSTFPGAQEHMPLDFAVGP